MLDYNNGLILEFLKKPETPVVNEWCLTLVGFINLTPLCAQDIQRNSHPALFLTLHLITNLLSLFRFGYGMMGAWPPISPLLSPYSAATFSPDGKYWCCARCSSYLVPAKLWFIALYHMSTKTPPWDGLILEVVPNDFFPGGSSHWKLSITSIYMQHISSKPKKPL